MTFYLCEACNYVFTSKMRRPIALPCGHTYCFRCLRHQASSNQSVQCFKCSTRHYQPCENYQPNHSILSMISSNNTTHIGNSNQNSKPIDSFGNIICRIESFTISKRNKVIKEATYLSLFNYFEVMKTMCFPRESNNWFRKLLKIVYIPFMMLLLLMINYACLIQMRFAEIFLVVSILYESEEITDEIIKKTKLWMSFLALHLINNFIEYCRITTWSIGMSVCICLRTIYVILVLGNDTSLNTVVFQLFSILNEVNLLVR